MSNRLKVYANASRGRFAKRRAATHDEIRPTTLSTSLLAWMRADTEAAQARIASRGGRAVHDAWSRKGQHERSRLSRAGGAK